MTVAVTGATGHVGANLLPALLADGEPVRALVHDPANDGVLDGVEPVRGDVRDPEAVARLVAGARLVYHLAARISIASRDDGTVRAVNVEGTRNVLAACRAHGARLVHFSSIHSLAAEPAAEAIDEGRALASDPSLPPYDRSKAEAERLVREAASAGLDAVIVNPTSIVGPRDHRPSEMGRALLAMACGRLPALVAGGFDFVDVRDVVAGARAAAARGRAGDSYLLSGEWRSVRELAALVAELAGVRAPRLVTPQWLARAAVPFAAGWAWLRGREPLLTAPALRALRNHRRVSHARATAALDYRPRPLRETIADTLAWFREAGRLS